MQITKDENINLKYSNSIIGSLKNVGEICSKMHYFISILRITQCRCEKFGLQRLSKEELNDLHFWRIKLKRLASQGVSINTFIQTFPANIIFTEACEHGIGGFSTNGQAWRFKLPNDIIGMFSINFLEFLAAEIGFIAFIEMNESKECFLASFGKK